MHQFGRLGGFRPQVRPSVVQHALQHVDVAVGGLCPAFCVYLSLGRISDIYFAAVLGLTQPRLTLVCNAQVSPSRCYMIISGVTSESKDTNLIWDSKSVCMRKFATHGAMGLDLSPPPLLYWRDIPQPRFVSCMQKHILTLFGLFPLYMKSIAMFRFWIRTACSIPWLIIIWLRTRSLSICTTWAFFY